VLLRRDSVRTSLGVAGTLLPFAVLFSAFLIFKMDAFRASLSPGLSSSC